MGMDLPRLLMMAVNLDVPIMVSGLSSVIKIEDEAPWVCLGRAGIDISIDWA